MKNVGFVGVGSMGKGMCENLIKNGYALAVFDISKAALSYFEGKASIMPSSLEAFKVSEVTFLALPNSDVVEKIVGEFLDYGVKNKIIIDTSTSYPLSTKELYKKVKDAGGKYIDAPLMAGPAEAASGTLVAMVSGDKQDIDEVDSLFKCYCKSYDYVGNSGNAHMIKIFQNFVGLTYALILGQLFPLVEKLGLDSKELQKMMDNEFFSNWVYRFYSEKFVNKDYRIDFALELAYKDLGYMKKMYDEFGVPAFALDGALDLLKLSIEDGKGKLDYSQMSATVHKLLNK